MEASAHPRQAERLQALYSYEILDTDPEQDFDDVARLAAAICETPIAVINLIDADRQWFKAEIGLGVRETPLATSICSHVILEDGFVEIGDTLADARMADNPLCGGEPGLRFYAGALLVSDNGLPIGTLCVLDWQPRVLSPVQRDALRVLARQVMAQLDLRRTVRQAELLRKEVDHRVKNSLQALSALARLQARHARNPDVSEALGAMDQRIHTVSMLHEQLYRTGLGSTVDLGHYVANLVDHLGKMAPAGVTVTADVMPLAVSTRQAASAGALVNEFVANAFKHAFPEGRTGTVRVCVGPTDEGLVMLECSDDGVGLPAVEVEGGSGLGMRICKAVCAQLGCRLSIGNGPDGGALARCAFRPEV